VPSAAYKVGGDVQAPIPIVTPDPEVPDAGMNTVHETRLWVILDCSGTPVTVMVYAPQGADSDEKGVAFELGNKARNEVLHWRFQPAKRRGKPVLVQFDVEFTFKVDKPNTAATSKKSVSVSHTLIYAPRTSSATAAVQ
jgi:hypothetical protein